MHKSLIILGIRGIPANHGGFETFAEELSQYLVSNGWHVTVYCQEEGAGPIYESEWKSVRLIHIPIKTKGSMGTIVFDLKSVLHALRLPGLILTLGYNTACFSVILRCMRRVNIINMDGIEWKRNKWGKLAKTWFWINERLGCWLGNYLIADHPCIEEHLSTRVNRKKITMIPYGANEVSTADETVLSEYHLERADYSIIIARPEPENSILEIVKTFSKKDRHHKLVVLGDYNSLSNSYHQSVISCASHEVLFPGAIYDSNKVSALRFFSRFYVHGHQVGGTNPSLVEALGAGCAIIAHDNPFNRWVAGDAGFFFKSDESLSDFFDSDFSNELFIKEKKIKAIKQFEEKFRWNPVLSEYEHLLLNAK